MVFGGGYILAWIVCGVCCVCLLTVYSRRASLLDLTRDSVKLSTKHTRRTHTHNLCDFVLHLPIAKSSLNIGGTFFYLAVSIAHHRMQCSKTIGVACLRIHSISYEGEWAQTAFRLSMATECIFQQNNDVINECFENKWWENLKK